MTLNIYIAGSYGDRERVARWMHEVQADTWENIKAAGDVRAPMVLAHDWITIIDQVRKQYGEDYDTDITDVERLGYAMGDLEEVRRSDAFWFLVPENGGRGCWFELGCAWSWRIPIICSGPHSRVTVFTQLSSAIFSDDADAFEWVKRYAQERS